MDGRWQTVKVDRWIDGVTRITLNRPEKRNAMNPAMHAEMNEVLAKLWDDPETRVIVLTGAGESFCAGMDLKEYFLDNDPAAMAKVREQSAGWQLYKLRAMPQPTIAMINGYCFGGGFGVIAACDLAIAADSATIGLSEINFGVFPGGICTAAMVDLLRTREALYYALTGEPFNGVKAAQLGVVNFSFPAAELEGRTLALCRTLLEKDPYALRMVKEVYKVSQRLNWEESLFIANGKMAELSVAQNSAWKERGIKDFLAHKYRSGLEGHPTGLR